MSPEDRIEYIKHLPLEYGLRLIGRMMHNPTLYNVIVISGLAPLFDEIISANQDARHIPKNPITTDDIINFHEELQKSGLNNLK
jgi:hypothetical protein